MQHVSYVNMPRKARTGKTAVRSVRLPHETWEQVDQAAGGTENWSEWIRNLIRTGLATPLDYQAGYEEGRAAGWADANQRFRAAMKRSQDA